MDEPELSESEQIIERRDRLVLGVGGLFLALIETHQALRHTLEAIEAAHVSPSDLRSALLTAKSSLELAEERLTEEGNDFFGVYDD